MEHVDEDRFAAFVDQALDSVPEELWRGFANVAVVVADRHPDEPDLLGLYEGVPLIDRWDYSGELPDRITLYRLALCDFCADEDELVEEIRVTVIHELAHHVGIDDDALHELGWA